MDISSLLAAYLAISGGHTLGHLDTANKTGAPARIDWQTGTEEWNRPDKEFKFDYKFYPAKNFIGQRTREAGKGTFVGTALPVSEESERHGGGFATQDKINNAINTPESSLANALFKAAYLSGVRFNGGNMAYKSGDIGGIAHNSGVSEDTVRGLISASALADLIKAYRPKDNWNFQFDITGGRPGLVYTKRW